MTHLFVIGLETEDGGNEGDRLGTSALLQLRDEGERIREILIEELVLFLAEKTGLCEALRRWSEEIEYSTENVRILMNA